MSHYFALSILRHGLTGNRDWPRARRDPHRIQLTSRHSARAILYCRCFDGGAVDRPVQSWRPTQKVGREAVAEKMGAVLRNAAPRSSRHGSHGSSRPTVAPRIQSPVSFTMPLGNPPHHRHGKFRARLSHGQEYLGRIIVCRRCMPGIGRHALL